MSYGDADYWKTKYERSNQDTDFWRKNVERLNARVATLEAELNFRDFKDLTDQAWLQRKVVLQGRELKRLHDLKAFRSAHQVDAKASTPEG